MVGSSRRAVQRAVAVQKVDPKLHEEVLAGKVTLEDARRLANPQKHKASAAKNRPAAKVVTAMGADEAVAKEPESEPEPTLDDLEREVSDERHRLKEEYPEIAPEKLDEIMLKSTNGAIEAKSLNTCNGDSDKPDCIIEFNSLVKRLSEQRHETEWQIKACIWGCLYFENLTDGPFIPGPLGD
jgi:hypothetical protein